MTTCSKIRWPSHPHTWKATCSSSMEYLFDGIPTCKRNFWRISTPRISLPIIVEFQRIFPTIILNCLKIFIQEYSDPESWKIPHTYCCGCHPAGRLSKTTCWSYFPMDILNEIRGFIKVYVSLQSVIFMITLLRIFWPKV